jgi:hypothetical protein
MPDKTSPLRAKLRRQAGQSTRAMLIDELFNRYLAYSLIGSLALLFFLYELLRASLPIPPQPGLFGIIAIPVASFCLWRVWKSNRRLKDIRLGLDGERRVAEVLDDLRSSGYHVFHDLVPEEKLGNLDHVVVGPSGVYAIETKTMRKIPKARSQIDHTDHDTLQIGGHEMKHGHLQQAERLAKLLHREIQQYADLNIAVQPVLVYPGWWIGKRPRERRVWVLNDGMLHGAIANQPPTLTEPEIKLIASHLERSVRTVKTGD